MEWLAELFRNKIFLSVILASVIAQIIKYCIHRRQDHPQLKSFLFAAGGMPSSHSAGVVALATGVFLVEGISTLFVAAVVFALFVMIDASGVRYATGQNTIKINKLVTFLHHQFNLKLGHAKVLLGHTVSQVIVGAIVGWVVTMVVFSL